MSARANIPDRLAREEAVRLLRLYASGQLTGGALREAWPRSTQDSSLEKLAWVVLPALGQGRLGQDLDVESQQGARELLDRCILFLGTDRPLTWGDFSGLRLVAKGFWTGLWLLVWIVLLALLHTGAALVATVIVLLVLAVGLQLLGRPVRLKSLTRGSWRHWPFDSPEDLDSARAKACDEPPGHGPPDA